VVGGKEADAAAVVLAVPSFDGVEGHVEER
jgi:hypothetical protein